MTRLPPRFVGDTIALDFLNSGHRLGDRQVDSLATGNGLLAWLQELQLLPAQTSQDLRARFSAEALDAAAAEARDLREWFRTFAHQHKGNTLVEGDLHELTRLNQLLERDGTYSQIVCADESQTRLDMAIRHRWQSPDSLVIALARALAAFICEEDFSAVKTCQRAGCELFFIDRTPRHIRKSCRRFICGDCSLPARRTLRPNPYRLEP